MSWKELKESIKLPRCCTKGCEMEAFITLHDEEKEYAKCGCVIHFYDAAWQFEDKMAGHKHFRYLLLCLECNKLLHHQHATLPTTSTPPTCIKHPGVPLRLIGLDSGMIFKECVAPTQEAIQDGITNKK